MSSYRALGKEHFISIPNFIEHSKHTYNERKAINNCNFITAHLRQFLLCYDHCQTFLPPKVIACEALCKKKLILWVYHLNGAAGGL